MASSQLFVTQQACPLLGSVYDRSTHCAYATDENVCHIGGKKLIISLGFQEDFCLAGQQATCNRFQYAQNHQLTEPLPLEFRKEIHKETQQQFPWKLVIFSAVFVIVVIAVFLLARDFPVEQSSGTVSQTYLKITPTISNDTLITITATPTSTRRLQLPTKTPTILPTMQPIIQETVPPATILKPTDQPFLIVARDPLNVRAGPGQTFEVIGALKQGDKRTVIGRNDDNSWIQLCCVSMNPGWVTTEFVTVSVPITTLVVVESIP